MTSKTLRKVQPAHKSKKVTVARAKKAWLKVEGKTVTRSSASTGTARNTSRANSNSRTGTAKEQTTAGDKSRASKTSPNRDR